MRPSVVCDLDLFGQGIIKVSGGTYFVKNALPKEEVTFEIKRKKKNIGFGVAKKIIAESPHRVTPICPYYGTCGGCQFQHCDYEMESKAKEKHLRSILKRMGGLEDPPVVPIDLEGEAYGYRNKVTWQMENGVTGYFQENTNTFLPIKSCPLLEEPLNEVTKDINKFTLQRVTSTILRCNELGEVAVTFVGEMGAAVIETMMAASPRIVSVATDTKFFGQKDFPLSLGDKTFLTSPQSFFQVNTAVAKSMLDYIKEILDPQQGGNLLDLYCGVGTMGIYLGDSFDEVYGVEAFKEALNFASLNAENNGIKGNFHHARTEDGLEGYLASIPQMDVVVVDPPRKGLDPKVVDILKDYNAETLLYISCDPGTLSRDLKSLKETYEIKSAKPFNLFPRTGHVECVCLMTRKEK